MADGIDLEDLDNFDSSSSNDDNYTLDGPTSNVVDLKKMIEEDATSEDGDIVQDFEESDSPIPFIKNPKKIVKEEKSIDNLDNPVNESVEILKDILREKGVDADILEFEDGTQRNVEDLTSEELDYFINELSETDTENQISEALSSDENFNLITEAYLDKGLNGVLELMKESGLLDVLQTEEDIFESRVDKLSDDELLILDIQEKCPHCDEDEIVEDLIRRKQSKSVGKHLTGLRSFYRAQEQEELQQLQQMKLEEQVQEIENQKQELISRVLEVPTIAGYKNTKDIQETILPTLLTPDDEEPYSVFMAELFADPVKQYKAAFYLKYAEEIMERHEKELKEAEERGKLKIFNGLPSKPKHKTSISTPTKNPVTRSGKGINIDDL